MSTKIAEQRTTTNNAIIMLISFALSVEGIQNYLHLVTLLNTCDSPEMESAIQTINTKGVNKTYHNDKYTKIRHLIKVNCI